MKKTLPILLCLICAAFISSAQIVFYVNQATGNDANSGASWSASFRNLTRALQAANATTATEVQIWVSAGVYTPVDGITPAPASASDTSFAFYRGNGVARKLKVYGGFAGTETSITDRDATHTTYLDGATGAGNSYHIGVIANLAADADSIILDGLQFRNGIATNTGVKAFNGNNIWRSYGGGLVLVNVQTPRVAIRNCVFNNNKAVSLIADGCGGAVYMNNSVAFFDGCTFSNNILSKDVSAPSGNIYGGALYVANGNLKLTGCAFNNNVSLGDGTNTVVNSGGALYLGYCDTAVYIKHCSFTGNMSRSRYTGYACGGGIFNFHTFVRAGNCSFTGNQASDSAAVSPATKCAGGAVYDNFLANSVYDSCTFVYNKVHSANGFGGTIFDTSSVTWITNSTLSNSAVTADGGAVYVSDYGTMSVQNCNIYNNSAGRGGVIFATGPTSVALAFSNIHNNTAVLGGAVFNRCSSFVMGTDSVHNNTASTGGAGIYNDSGFIVLQRLDVWSNTVTAGSGGGMYIRGGHCTMDTSTFGGNTAVNGGGIMIADSAKLYINRSLLTGNRATGNGGGISLAGTLGIPADKLFNCSRNIFINNKAATGGGAISINSLAGAGIADTIVNNLFIGNSATNAGAHGGAISATGTVHFICNNTFVSDSASYGGAISAQGSGYVMKAVNNIFAINYATSTSSTDTSIHAAGSYLFTNNLYSGTAPAFVNAANPIGADGIWASADDGLMLQHCSPAVNAGNNTYLTSIAIDITGGSRIIAGTVDMGAYETETIGAITGMDSACAGTVVTYSDTSLGGTWTSSNPTIIIINATTGVATALAAGTATISYQRTYSCGSDIKTLTVTVLVAPATATITGPDTVCQGSHITLTSSLPDGIWGNILSYATVTPLGVVSGITPGVDTITYTLGNMCGSATNTFAVTVLGIPAATISGPAVVCAGSQITLTSSLPGGIWGNILSYATVTPLGVVSGITPGVDTITYTLGNMCGSATNTFAVTVLGIPAATISGPAVVCEGSQITLTSSLPGGTWNNVVGNATVTSSGLVTGVTPGADTITYSISGICGSAVAMYPITVYTTAQCDSATSVGPITGNNYSLLLSPNPAHGSVNIKVTALITENATAVMTNTIGVAVKKWTISTNKNNEVVLDVPAGIYLITISNNHVRYNAKIVID